MKSIAVVFEIKRQHIFGVITQNIYLVKSLEYFFKELHKVTYKTYNNFYTIYTCPLFNMLYKIMICTQVSQQLSKYERILYFKPCVYLAYFRSYGYLKIVKCIAMY